MNDLTGRALRRTAAKWNHTKFMRRTGEKLSFVEFWRMTNDDDHNTRAAHQQKNSLKRRVK